MTSPDVVARLAALGAEPLASSPAEFAQVISTETRRWTEIVKAANIKLE